MQDSLIEQVKRLAEAQEAENLRLLDSSGEVVDFPALLDHMQAQQAVVDAARSVLVALGVDDVPYTGIKRALENLENRDGK